jgi:hypothetical protein
VPRPLRHRARARAQVNVEAEGDYGLPEVLQQYHSLYPLEDLGAAADAPSQAFGVATQVVKAVSSLDGQAAALRRVDGRQARRLRGSCVAERDRDGGIRIKVLSAARRRGR